MAKLVVLVLSDPKEKRKVMTGLKFAKIAKDSGEFEDVRLIISAQAVDIFKQDDFKDVLDEVKASLQVNVCKMNAEAAGVLKEAEQAGTIVGPVGKDLIALIKAGYEVVSF